MTATRATVYQQVHEKSKLFGIKISEKETELVVESVLDAIRDSLSRGERVEFRGFGAFVPVTRKAKKVRKSTSGRFSEQMEIPARKTFKFKPSKKWIDKLNVSI